MSPPGSGAGDDAEQFDVVYRSDDDPWRFRTSWYEQRKRDLTLAALPRRRYASAFEPGCSVGVLTTELAPRCDRLLSVDFSAAAVALARRATVDLPQVTVERLAVPEGWPAGSFDLVMLSEIGYYLNDDRLTLLLDRTVAALRPGGTVVACHWRHPAPDHERPGDEVHDLLRARADLAVLVTHEEEDFWLDVLVAGEARSVARDEGLLP